MSTVSIRKLKNPAMRAFKHVCAVTAGITLAVSVFAMTDDDGYLFLLGKNTKIGSMIMHTVQTITTTISGSETKGNAVGSKGVNYLLVAQMNEGYAKDYLSIALENQNGKLDRKKRKFYMSPEALVATNVAESSCYGINGGGTLPKSDIPESKVRSGYGKNGISLYTWDKDMHATGGATKIGGPLAFTPDYTRWTDLGAESVYNTKHTKTRNDGLGDGFLFPDAVCGANLFSQRALSELGVSISAMKSSEYADLIAIPPAVANHNSGSGFIKQLYGKQPFGGKNPKKTEKETIERLSVLIGDFKKTADSLSEKQFSDLLKGYQSASGEYYGYAVLISQGWKIADSVKNRCVNNYGQMYKMWNYLFPNNKVSNKQQLNTELEKYVYSIEGLAREMGMSVSKFRKVYLDGKSSYRDAVLSYNSGLTTQGITAGVVKVLDGKTSAWGAECPRIMHIGGLQLKPITTALLFSGRIVRRMMIYGGVDKDLVDGIQVSDMAANGGTVNAGNFTMENKYWNKLKAYGCDRSQLTKNRYKVLRNGLKIIEHTTRYSQSYSLGRCGTPKCTRLNHNVYDCSSFVAHAVNAAGFKPGMPTTTSGYLNNRSVVKVDPADVLPGDPLCQPGHHVYLFIGRKHGKICSMEAMSTKNGIGCFTTRMSNRGYYVYRPKDFY